MSNKLVECMMDQCDVEDHFLHSILDHRKTKEAVEKEDVIFTTPTEQKKRG